MKSNVPSPFASRFRSLPDGRRVFYADFPWSAHYLIPNLATERYLYRKTVWANTFLFTSTFMIFIWLSLSGRFISSYRYGYIGSLSLISFFLLAAVTRWILYRNDVHTLQKIDFSSAISSFYDDLRENLRSHSQNSLPNYEISSLLDIPDSNDKIIMLKYTQLFQNVLRCQLDGSILWQAELPAANDVYTNIEWKDQRLHAFSQSGKSVWLDENTGRIRLAELSVRQNSA